MSTEEIQGVVLRSESKFASRKFTMAAVVIVAAFLAVVLKIEVSATIADLIKWVIGLYFTSNVVQKGVEAFSASK